MNQHLDIDRVTRMESMGIDESTKRILHDCVPHIEKVIDGAIRDSYQLIMRYPEAARAYAGMNLEEAVAAQRKHWLEDILPATFSEAQLENCVALFSKRQQQGLPLRWYFVFYTNVMRHMIRAIGPAFGRRPERFQQAVEALVRVVIFEVELAAAAYMKSAQDGAAITLNKNADAFEQEIAGLVKMVGASVAHLQTASDTMATVADQTAEEAKTAATATQQTSSNVQTVSAATEQLSSSIQEISTQVGKSVAIAESAVCEAERTNTLVQGLSNAVDKIGDVVKLINSIASQTNLLALNATIEAARAGEAGKGFSVVAGEVKSLANQTAKATEDISAQIAAVQAATRDAVTAIKGIGATIVSINEISTAISSAVEEQGAATQEISRSVQGAAEGSVQMGKTITAVDNLAGQTSGTARDLSAAVGTLSEQTTQLSSQVAAFLEKIRKAG